MLIFTELLVKCTQFLCGSLPMSYRFSTLLPISLNNNGFIYSIIANLCPCIVFSILENTKKWNNALSGKHYGYRIITVLFLAENPQTKSFLWTVSLSSCTFHKSFYHKNTSRISMIGRKNKIFYFKFMTYKKILSIRIRIMYEEHLCIQLMSRLTLRLKELKKYICFSYSKNYWSYPKVLSVKVIDLIKQTFKCYLQKTSLVINLLYTL